MTYLNSNETEEYLEYFEGLATNERRHEAETMIGSILPLLNAGQTAAIFRKLRKRFCLFCGYAIVDRDNPCQCRQARLLAAAPDLLRECKDLLDSEEASLRDRSLYDEHQSCLIDVRAAIAKAEGKEVKR